MYKSKENIQKMWTSENACGLVKSQAYWWASEKKHSSQCMEEPEFVMTQVNDYTQVIAGKGLNTTLALNI